MRPRLAAVMPLLVGLLLTVSPAISAGATTGNNYVAMGDSFTSAPFVLFPSTTQVLGCEQSTNNYPHLLARQLRLSLTDVSCGGATVENAYNSQSTQYGDNPPQLNPVSGSTDVVTVGLGGDDLDFTQIIENCAALTPSGPTLSGAQNCQSYYTVNGVDSLALKIMQTGPKLANVLRQIHQRAPKAKVFVIGYPHLLPDSGQGCWPSMPFTTTDLPFLRTTEQQLNDMLAYEAGRSNATFVDTFGPSTGHDACQPEGVRWVEPVLVPESLAYPLHPGAFGEQQLAGVIAPYLTKAGF